MKVDRRSAIAGVGLLVLAVGAVVLWRLTARSGPGWEQYATFEQARSAGVFERGLPEKCVPPGTHTHYLYAEAGTVWGAFDYPAGAEQAFRARVTLLTPAETQALKFVAPPSRVHWWHGGLNERGTPTHARAMGMGLFGCDGFVLAVDPGLKAAFYWRVGK